MMMEHSIREILKKYDIKDENLVKALTEIFNIFYEESKRKAESDLKIKAFQRGIQL